LQVRKHAFFSLVDWTALHRRTLHPPEATAPDLHARPATYLGTEI
jgi:hypothetical protein